MRVKECITRKIMLDTWETEALDTAINVLCQIEEKMEEVGAETLCCGDGCSYDIEDLRTTMTNLGSYIEIKTIKD